MITLRLKNIILLFNFLMITGCIPFGSQRAVTFEEFCTMFDKKIVSVDDVYRFFPKTVNEIKTYAEYAQKRAQKDLDILIAFDKQQRTFDNTAGALDKIGGDFAHTRDVISVLEMVSPDADIRKTAHEQIIAMNVFAVDAFSNKKLYNAFKDYVESNAQQENLNAEQRYFLQETMRDFVRDGLDLSDEKLEEVKNLKKELSALALNFETNINTDKSTVSVSKDELHGCDEHFINNLRRDDSGMYVLGCDYPTYAEVMEHCTVESTRKKLYFAYNNRAYPQNKTLLEKMIAQRDVLAKKLSFASYAALDIDGKMAQNPERVEQFITDLGAKAHKKSQQELAAFAQDLPDGVSCDESGKYNLWDLSYIKAYYKKKHFNIDEREIAEYFPVQKAIAGVFDIYQQFLNLDFKLTKPAWAWHDDVQLIEVHDKDSNRLRGYIFLDLYPRDDKYSHACHCGLVQTTQRQLPDGTIDFNPSVALVIANFPQATVDRPALLKHRDVETFFHEFGHAMHFLLGSTELVSFSGTNVKWDFVEMPSQIFEEWMFDKQLLKNMGSHYITGKPLSDEFIAKLIDLKKFDSGMFVERQCWLSMISLAYYKEGGQKDTDAIAQDFAKKMMPHIRFEHDTHMQASFGHLTGYGAKYYCYMWSKVFALDLFYVIKKQGLLDAKAGKVFVDKILSKGGSVDPNTLLKDFLGRAPSQDAFFKDLGISQ